MASRAGLLATNSRDRCAVLGPRRPAHGATRTDRNSSYSRNRSLAGYLLAVSVMSVLFSKRLGSWPSVRRVPLMQMLVVSLLGGS